MIRAFAVVCGLAVIGAATQKNIEVAGGWASSDTPLIVALALFLIGASAFAAIEWHRSRLVAVIVLLSALGAEGYWLAVNTERELAARAAAASPHIQAKAQRNKALNDVREAEAALRSAPQFSGRLDRALAVKAAVDDAVRAKAAERGCATNCRALLEAQVATADREVSETRVALAQEIEGLRRRVADAKAALAALPPLAPHASLAEVLGLPQWQWDLVIALLRSLAVVGASVMVAHVFRLEGQRSEQRCASDPVALAPATAMLALPPAAEPPGETDTTASRHAARFIGARLRHAPGQTVPLAAVHLGYIDWCEREREVPAPISVIVPALQKVLMGLGVRGVMLDGVPHVCDVREVRSQIAA